MVTNLVRLCGVSESTIEARSDFTAAATQLSIGLVQTLVPPATEPEWLKGLTNSEPIIERLAGRIAELSNVFGLDGDGPRFMQDAELRDGEPIGIADLLFEDPGSQGVQLNTDHFIKRDHVTGLCYSCAKIALYARQNNAASGGVGYRTSLRGGGPLTTLVVGETSWQTIWLNILTRPQFESLAGNPANTEISATFPWMAPTRTSRKHEEVLPQDAHPAQMLWGMPWRIRLVLDNLEPGTCSVCGDRTDQLITQMIKTNYGANYAGAWLHPLSPYNVPKDEFPASRKANGVNDYRYWLGLVQSSDDGKTARKPAVVVRTFLERSAIWPELVSSVRVWAHGYNLDKAKINTWDESTMPLVTIDLEHRSDYDLVTAQMVKAAGDVAFNTMKAIKSALNEVPAFIKDEFFTATEGEFFATLTQARDALLAGEELNDAREVWFRILTKQSQKLFDEHAPVEDFDTVDPKRVVTANKNLRKNNFKVRGSLGLPQEVKNG